MKYGQDGQDGRSQEFITSIRETHLEKTVLAWFQSPEGTDYGQVVLIQRLRDALRRINPGMPDEVIEDAIRQVTRIRPNQAVARQLICQAERLAG